MKVCHISFNHDAFDDRIYWKELLALKEAGYEPIHICVGEEERRFMSSEGVEIIQVKRRIPSMNIWISRLLQLLFRNRSTIHDVMLQVEEVAASVYHYHDLQINALVKKIKELPQKPKVIYDAHEAYHLLLKENTRSFLQRLLKNIIVHFISKWEIQAAKHCDYVITTDEYTCSYFKKKLRYGSVSIIHNYSYFLPAVPKLIKKKWDIIYTGLISEARGIRNVLLAISHLKKSIPAASFLIIGSFEHAAYKEELLRKISELNIGSNVTLHSQVPFSEIGIYYQQSRIGIGLFHKTPKYETFIPIKLFEYMSYGLPVVFSDQGPSAAIIRNSQCGILVDYNNPEAVCTSLKTLLENKSVYEKFSENAQIAVASKYNWVSEKSKLIDVYLSLVNPEQFKV